MSNNVKNLSNYKKDKIKEDLSDILIDKEGTKNSVILTIDKDKYKDLLLKSGYTEKDIEIIKKEKAFLKR